MSPNNNKKSQKNINYPNESSRRRILHHTKILESKEQHNNDYDSTTTLHGFHTSHDKEKASE